jgi:hypothetical protein
MITDKIGAQDRERKAVLTFGSQPIRFCTIERAKPCSMRCASGSRSSGGRRSRSSTRTLGSRTLEGPRARAGLERTVAEVCLGKVGAVAAREVSRNSRDWQQLVEMCCVVDMLLIDQEASYAPRQGNGLLLGSKGSLNEYELDLLRQRGSAC